MDYTRNNGLATREDLEVVRGRDVIELSQSEFKDVVDARHGALTLPALERLHSAARRQAAAKQNADRGAAQ